MSSWLRNIQGQLSDLANEVLSEAGDVLAEATEEVADPDTELVVAKRNCAEAEKKLAIESARVGSLEGEKKHLEQQLYDAHVEMDAIGTKLNGFVRQRDEEIKKLKNQLEQMHESGWNEGGADEEVVAELKSQVAHWKALAEADSDSGETISMAEMERRLEDVRLKKEHEIQAIIESHAESMVEIREMYEEKLSAMQVMPMSSSTSNADTDAVLLEKDELQKSRSDLVDLGSREELVDEKEAILESLKTQNEELVKAYDELNAEFEQFKLSHAATENRNRDLNLRIDSLKANLIEYEERYELCRKENIETVGQLEKLSADFERLRSGVANVSQRRENCDSMVNEEVEKLKNALDESRAERERLRDDVQKFTVSVAEIDVELEKLRDMNRQLLAENQALTQNISTYDQTMRDIVSSSEKDISQFRDQFRDIQTNHQQQREALVAENAALRDETEAIKAQRDILQEESRLLKEVNEKLKQKSATEESKIELLAKKAELLQQVLDEERAEQQKKEQEQKDQKKESEDPKDPEVATLKAQLLEALQANEEKSDECEKLKTEARALEREVDLRQNCVDEMIAQTNTLQLQQETMSAANRNLQTQVLLNERQIVLLEEDVKELTEQMAEKEKKIGVLEAVLVGEDEGKDVPELVEVDLEAEDQHQHPGVIRRYVLHLKKKLAETEEELKLIKEEKSDESREAAQVRKALEKDLYEAAEVDRGLLEGIEARVLEMEQALEAKVVMLAEANQKKVEVEEKLEEMMEKLKISDASQSEQEVLQKIHDVVLQERNQLKEENENLKAVATTHHSESVRYYEQCQAMAQQTEQLAKRMKELEEKIAGDTDSHEKRTKELQRLREHLMIVEETSTREAVESEQRETELRARVRELEAKGHAVEEGATESTQQYQVEIASLTGQLESSQKTLEDWKRKYEMEVKAREQTQEALGSLQNVVRELSVDHERDSATASHRNLELQTQMVTLHDEISQIREDLDRQSISRQAAEEESERRQLQLDSKQKIIEDLEQQIEDLRNPVRATDSYRIDDSTLRQLFLNYFNAEPAKRPDIAMLLASILEYPPEEMDKFRSAVRQSFQQSSGSSFFFGSASRGSTPPGGSSISEQFIRFLEVESESSRTAPHLPIRSGAPAPPMSLDSPRQKSTSPQPSQASASSSAAALDSLLR